jgi:mutator protein MutT
MAGTLPRSDAEAEPETIVVAAAVVERNGAFLLTRRLSGTHLAGYWEFPGGKCGAHETLEGCLVRELVEELDAAAIVREKILSTRHAYPGRIVELHFYRCELVSEPRPVLDQEMRWVGRSELRSVELPPADAELVDALTSGASHA